MAAGDFTAGLSGLANAMVGMKKSSKEKISNTMSKLIWINNGIENRRVKPDNIPTGWVKGRLILHEISEETKCKMSKSLKGQFWIYNPKHSRKRKLKVQYLMDG